MRCSGCEVFLVEKELLSCKTYWKYYKYTFFFIDIKLWKSISYGRPNYMLCFSPFKRLIFISYRHWWCWKNTITFKIFCTTMFKTIFNPLFIFNECVYLISIRISSSASTVRLLPNGPSKLKAVKTKSAKTIIIPDVKCNFFTTWNYEISDKRETSHVWQ